MIFDSHAHYNDKKFEHRRDELLDSLFANTVGAIVNASVDVAGSKKTLELCSLYPRIYAAIGIHPSEVELVGELDDALYELEQLAANEKVVAIGEIGLDYHFEPYDKQKQAQLFELQLELARKLKLPVVIHDREAHGDVDAMMRRYPDVKILLHSYSGSAEWARELIEQGRYLSFSGVLTFKNARRAVEAAASVPLDRILLETDCPYLAPEPLRGSVNDSGNIIHTATCLARIKGMTTDEILDITFKNACNFFEIDI